jgi:hypothetical protein
MKKVFKCGARKNKSAVNIEAVETAPVETTQIKKKTQPRPRLSYQRVSADIDNDLFDGVSVKDIDSDSIKDEKNIFESEV